MKFDSDALNEMVMSVNLLEYAERSFEFKRQGSSDYFTHCPLHVDNTPSLSINTETNLWYCHSCHKGGNLINWIMVFEKLSFEETIKKISEISGKKLEEISICEAIQYYKKLRDARNKKHDEPVEREIFPYESYTEKYDKEYPEEWLEEGITREAMDLYDIRVDHSTNRIVYPVLDKDFNLIGVKGRTRFKNYKELKIQKYMNYNKIKTTDYFTGMKQALPYIEKTHEVIIVEGIKSAMKLYFWGNKTVISSETDRLNSKQIELLIKLQIKTVVLAFDQDVDRARLQGIASNLRHFMNVYAVIDRDGVLEPKMSPCDKGKEVWDMLYEKKVRL